MFFRSQTLEHNYFHDKHCLSTGINLYVVASNSLMNQVSLSILIFRKISGINKGVIFTCLKRNKIKTIKMFQHKWFFIFMFLQHESLEFTLNIDDSLK